MKHIVVLVFYLFFFTGCSGLFFDRTFSDEMDRDSSGFWEPNEDFPVVSGDSGRVRRTKREIFERTPASSTMVQKDRDKQRVELEVEEKIQLLSEEEFDNYRSHEKYLLNDSEKIYYLGLNKNTRLKYIAEKRGGELNAEEYNTLDYLKIRKEQITSLELGMSKDEVLQNYGRPSQVDIAGNPRHENERWSFTQGRNRKYIYFEGGKVQGWAQD